MVSAAHCIEAMSKIKGETQRPDTGAEIWSLPGIGKDEDHPIEMHHR
jgi:hypothetical protein